MSIGLFHETGFCDRVVRLQGVRTSPVVSDGGNALYQNVSYIMRGKSERSLTFGFATPNVFELVNFGV